MITANWHMLTYDRPKIRKFIQIRLIQNFKNSNNKKNLNKEFEVLYNLLLTVTAVFKFKRFETKYFPGLGFWPTFKHKIKFNKTWLLIRDLKKKKYKFLIMHIIWEI